MFQAAIWGRLGGDPKRIETQSGKPMTVARVAVNVGQGEDGEPEWVGLVAFERLAEPLARHGKGDCVSASGRVERKSWTDKQGERREELQVIADSLVSSRSVRPQSGKAAS